MVSDAISPPADEDKAGAETSVEAPEEKTEAPANKPEAEVAGPTLPSARATAPKAPEKSPEKAKEKTAVDKPASVVKPASTDKKPPKDETASTDKAETKKSEKPKAAKPKETKKADAKKADPSAAEPEVILDAGHSNALNTPFTSGTSFPEESDPEPLEPTKPSESSAKDEPEFEENFRLYEWFEEHFNGNLGYTYPLRARSFTGTTFGDDDEGEATSPSPTVSATLTYVPAPSYFARLTYIRYLDPDAQRPWNPDFAYSFGYDNWRPNTFSFSYSNYGANRISPGKDERFTDFLAGSLSLGYKFSLDDPLASLFEGERKLGCNTLLGMAPIRGPVKSTVSFSCRYGIWKGLYVTGGAKFYPVPDQQQPWDPDYVYGFGYSGLGHKNVSFAYNNFAAKRWPWRKQPDNSGSFLDGSISLSYKLPF